MKPEGENCSTDSANDKRKNWDKIVIKHLIAWFILLTVGALIWRLATPIWVENNTTQSQQEQESTSTAVSENTSTSGATVAKPPLRATVKTSSNGTTTTTVRATRQRQTVTPSLFQVKIIVEALNVRTAPSLQGQVITTLEQGEIVQVLESKGQWLKIITSDNSEGYIHANDSLVQVIR